MSSCRGAGPPTKKAERQPQPSRAPNPRLRPDSSTAGRTAASTNSCHGDGPQTKTAAPQAKTSRACKPRLRSIEHLQLKACLRVSTETKEDQGSGAVVAWTWAVLTASDRPAPLLPLRTSSCHSAARDLRENPVLSETQHFHKIMKSGCRAEEARLRSAERIANLIALFYIVAWRILWLGPSPRASPHLIAVGPRSCVPRTAIPHPYSGSHRRAKAHLEQRIPDRSLRDKAHRLGTRKASRSPPQSVP